VPTPMRSRRQPPPNPSRTTDLAILGLAVVGVTVFVLLTIVRRPHRAEETPPAAPVVHVMPRIAAPPPVEPRIAAPPPVELPATTLANAPAITKAIATVTKYIPATKYLPTVAAEAPPVAAVTPAAVSDQPPTVTPAAEANPGGEAGVSASDAPRAIKRIRDRTEGNLLDELLSAPVVALDRSPDRTESMQFAKANAARRDPDLTLSLIDQRRDFVGLPLRRGEQAHLSASEARVLAELAPRLSANVGLVLAQGPLDKSGFQPRHIPALMQVLMVASERARVTLAEILGEMGAPEAAKALVRMALFDLNPAVRQAAIAGLERYPGREYVPGLLQGFEHPWRAVAEHAAEALVALRRTEAVPALLKVLHAPDPGAPATKPGGPALYVKEVVRINHELNCLLCHPPSFHTSDRLRREMPSLFEGGRVPETSGGSSTPGGSGRSSVARSRGKAKRVTGDYLSGPATRPTPRPAAPRWDPTFVRADVTFLKQDYSVWLAGSEKEAMRPSGRYDLFVRERLATSADADTAAARLTEGKVGHQRAAAFALRELTGKEAGRNEYNWRTFAGNPGKP
jgi:hypothetical protein